MNPQYSFIPNFPLQSLKAKVYTPLNLKDLVLWLDLSDTSTITKDASNKVSRISDKSSAGNHAIQSTSTAQPTWLSDQRNGLPIIRFNGTSTFIESPLNIDYTVNPKLTMFWVYKKNSTSPTNQSLFGQDDGFWDRFVLLGHSSLGASISTGITALGVAALGTVGTWRSLNIKLQDNVSNGSYVGFNNAFSTNFSEVHDNVGRNVLRIGEIGNNTIFGNFDLAEVIICKTILSNLEISETNKYLSRKWALGF